MDRFISIFRRLRCRCSSPADFFTLHSTQQQRDGAACLSICPVWLSSSETGSGKMPVTGDSYERAD